MFDTQQISISIADNIPLSQDGSLLGTSLDGVTLTIGGKEYTGSAILGMLPSATSACTMNVEDLKRLDSAIEFLAFFDGIPYADVGHILSYASLLVGLASNEAQKKTPLKNAVSVSVRPRFPMRSFYAKLSERFGREDQEPAG